MKFYFFLISALFTAQAETFSVSSNVSYKNPNSIFINSEKMDSSHKKLLFNDLALCPTISIAKTEEESSWKLDVVNSNYDIILLDKIKQQKSSQKYTETKNKHTLVHKMSQFINGNFNCDTSWTTSFVVNVVKSAPKKTRLYLQDISGTYYHKMFDNNSLNTFPVISGDSIYFTSIVNNEAKVVSINIYTGRTKVEFSEESGYIVISDVMDDKILYTRISANGELQILSFDLISKGKEILSRYNDAFSRNKINILPKWSKTDKNFIYFISKSNKTFYLIKANVSNGTSQVITSSDSLTFFDLNSKDDIIFVSKVKGRKSLLLFKNNQIFRLDTLSGNIQSPYFVNDNAIVYMKENSKTGLKNLFYFNLLNQKTIKTNIASFVSQNYFISPK